MIIKPQYQISMPGFVGMFKDEPKGFINGIARVLQKNKTGYIKTDGTLIGNKWFQYGELFQK